MVYLAIILPAVVSIQNGNSNPPPPFDVGISGPYFSAPAYQIPATILVLITPIFGSGIAFLLNGNKKNLTVFMPMIVFYLLLIYFLIVSNY